MNGTILPNLIIQDLRVLFCFWRKEIAKNYILPKDIKDMNFVLKLAKIVFSEVNMLNTQVIITPCGIDEWQFCLLVKAGLFSKSKRNICVLLIEWLDSSSTTKNFWIVYRRTVLKTSVENWFKTKWCIFSMISIEIGLK